MTPRALLATLAPLLCLGLLGASLSGPEEDLAGAISSAYRAARHPVPTVDPALSAAARALAQRVADRGPKAATDPETLAAELSRAGSWDPPPRVLASRATPADRAAASLAARDDLASEPATHIGVGLAAGPEGGAAVALFSSRRAALEPFPRAVRVGATERLEGRLAFPLYDGKVIVTGPSGLQRPAALSTGARNRFAADVAFPVPGPYAIEVVAQSAAGPEVAALFQVQAGAPGEGAARPADRFEPERADLAKAQAQVLAALNARRAAAGLKPLARSSLLDSVAQDHASEMARLDYFAHVSPVHGDVAQRATRAGFRFRRITENLGEDASALEAHGALEASPGHLSNILDPKVDLVGLGTARVRRGAIENVLLTEVFGRAAP